MSGTIFETSRLIGRCLSMEDVEVTERNYATRGYGMTALVLKESGEVVGFCGLVHPGGQPECEIKYALRRAFWGQGLATEAVRAMLAYGARTHGLSRVIATIYPENTASARVLAKAGMQEVETRQNDDGTFTKVFAWQPPGILPR
jgi:ribosomal-protein-alanine N-acetyltransferase